MASEPAPAEAAPRGPSLAEYSSVLCPLCNQVARSFEPFGIKPRLNARCPVCGSLERHRLIWLYLLGETDLFDSTPKRLLHFAPEPVLRSRFLDAPNLDYVAADLQGGNGVRQIDITEIDEPDSSFDALIASHVLEHVPDDRAALREVFRVLRPGGWAILQVPMFGELTDEDPSVVHPQQRLERFHQHDHVRAYGRDYPYRLAEAGFAVTVDRYPARLGEGWRRRFCLTPEDVHFCRRPLPGAEGGIVDRIPISLPAPGPQRFR